ncbi:hypothetical protein NQ317_013659 [Molorchus minor]|uniref:Peptidase S1 domain-containing protein n=1 Tax=Molorchus minor TaxID=1323400 RepID=A0ABQ9IZV0_9CUCU|nr:hypothetical protein NQ317_013659 [Molorchus minor]
MKSQPVLIEVEDKTNNKVFGCSGLMLNKKYVITTANLFLCEDSQNIFEELEPGKLYTNLFPNYNNTLNVVWNEDGLYVVKRPYIFAAFVSKNIKHSSKHIFQNWAIDSIDNNKDLSKILSVFVVLNFVKMESLESIKEIFSEWWDLSMSDNFNKGGSVYIRSVPFGNREFMDSVSQGIISNIFGTNECFVLSDCPSTPGSEGSPVYLSNRIHSASCMDNSILLNFHMYTKTMAGLTTRYTEPRGEIKRGGEKSSVDTNPLKI